MYVFVYAYVYTCVCMCVYICITMCYYRYSGWLGLVLNNPYICSKLKSFKICLFVHLL